MKKGMKILTLVLSLLIIFGSVSVAVIAADEEVTPIPYSEFDFGDFDDYAENADGYSDELEDILGENSGSFIAIVVIALICVVLFLPLIIIIVVFLVLNSKQKKKLREYEMRFGYILEEPYANTIGYNSMNNYQGGNFNE